MDAFERLTTWLAFHGHTVQKRRGQTFVRVARKRHGPMKIYLTLTMNGWVARGDRKTHRSVALERLVREFNEAERYISGPLSDQWDEQIRATLAAQSDAQVQQMADWYRAKPRPTLADAQQLGGLVQLVMHLRYIDACLAEPAKRDATFAVAGGLR